MKAARRRPFQVTVGGQTLRVEWADIADYGMYLHDEKKIVLSVKLQDDADGLVSTLRHEMLHAAFAISGHSFGWTSEQEEQVVRCLDGIFFPAWEKVLAAVRKHYASNP